MGFYIHCPKCGEETLDDGTLTCSECGWYEGKESEEKISELEKECERLRQDLENERRLVTKYSEGQLSAEEALANERARAEKAERGLAHAHAGPLPDESWQEELDRALEERDMAVECTKKMKNRILGLEGSMRGVLRQIDDEPTNAYCIAYNDLKQALGKNAMGKVKP